MKSSINLVWSECLRDPAVAEFYIEGMRYPNIELFMPYPDSLKMVLEKFPQKHDIHVSRDLMSYAIKIDAARSLETLLNAGVVSTWDLDLAIRHDSVEVVKLMMSRNVKFKPDQIYEMKILGAYAILSAINADGNYDRVDIPRLYCAALGRIGTRDKFKRYLKYVQCTAEHARRVAAESRSVDLVK